jgi:glucose-1-phosphate thymidylyltransferase
VVKFDENMKAVQIVEKPKVWISDYIIPGLYIYDKRVVEAAKTVKPSARGEIEIADLHNWYLEKGELEVGLVKGKWLDAGTFDSLLEAGNYVKEKKLYENFHPIINQAIEEFNEELKALAKKKL